MASMAMGTTKRRHGSRTVATLPVKLKFRHDGVSKRGGENEHVAVGCWAQDTAGKTGEDTVKEPDTGKGPRATSGE